MMSNCLDLHHSPTTEGIVQCGAQGQGEYGEQVACDDPALDSLPWANCICKDMVVCAVLSEVVTKYIRQQIDSINRMN